VHYALSSELAKIGALTVYSRQSVLRYRGSDRPLPEIARELGVDALLEGAVFKSGDSVRITVHLLRARPEQQMLEATHDGLLSHALVLHNVVAREIADSVHARLAPAEARERRAAKRVVDPAADKAFLAGLYHLERSLKGQLITGPEQAEVLDSAIHHFKKAIALEPEWSAPHARISTAYRLRSTHFTEDTAAEYDRRAKAEALRGIELDETDAEAHASLASVLLFRDRDWVGAGRAIRRSLELDPYARAMTAASYMTAAGRHDEAIAEHERARQLDPLSRIANANLTRALYWARRYDEAIVQARRTLELDPAFKVALFWLEGSLRHKGLFKEAVALRQSVSDRLRDVRLRQLQRATAAADWLKARDKDKEVYGPATGYVRGSTNGFEEIGRVEARYNRLAVYPGLAIVLAALAFNLLGDALRDVLDPRTTR